MGFWSTKKLLENQFFIDFLNQRQMDTNAYTLSMGDCYFVTGDESNQSQQKKRFLQRGEPFIIPAGLFAYLVTAEQVFAPSDAMAFISMKTRIKFKWFINVSGFHVDPGYERKLLFSVFNANPSQIKICGGDPIFKIWFSELDRPSAYEHLFQGADQSTIEDDLICGTSKEIYSLQSIAQKFLRLENDIERRFEEQGPTIKNLTSLWRSLQTEMTVALFTAVLTISLPVLWETGNWIKDPLFSEATAVMPETDLNE